MITPATWRTVSALVVLSALVALSIFLFSPYHHRPVQGRQGCVFFQVEQNAGLEACAFTLPEPRLILCQVSRETEGQTRGYDFQRLPSLRAPPAAIPAFAVL